MVDMKKIIVALTFLIAMASGFSGKGQNFKIVGYAPNWINLTTFSANFNYSRVSHLNIAFKDPDVNGDLPALTTGETALITAAHAHGVGVLLSLCGGASSEDEDMQDLYATLTNSTNRSAFAHKLKQYVLDNNLDGLDLDLEGDAIVASTYGGFVQVLADSLHPEGRLLTAALSQGYGGSKVPSSTFAYFDWINIMAYDNCGPTWGTPGQHSPYQMAVDALNYWKGRGLAKSKAVLGLPFYGYEFGAVSRRMYAISYRSVAASYPSATNEDETPTTGGNTVYYNGISTIIDKTSLALTDGGGVMIWDLSLDAANDNYSLLKNIRAVVGTNIIAGTEDILDEKTISVFPNPTTGTVTLKGDFLNQVTLDLYNSIGQKIQSYSETTSLDMSEEPKGIYYLHIRQEEKTTVRKIVLH